jgi:hypothetical protein
MTTHDRKDMRRHLYGRKKPCPMSVNPVELTDEIRDYILQNRVYHIPKDDTPSPAPQTINQTINNYNTVNNVIAGMELQEKLMQYMEFTKSKTEDVYASIERKLARRALGWKEDRRGQMWLSPDDIMEVIDDVTCISDDRLEDMNIIYDSKYDKLKLYDSGGWRNMLVKTGCKMVLQYVQECMLDAYESYLAKRMHAADAAPQQKQQYREALTSYYKFLACFDIEPYAKDRSDEDIIEGAGDESSSHAVSDELMELYRSTAAALVSSEQAAMRKEVIGVFKRNGKRNIDDLNRKLAQLFKMDEEFRTRVMTSIA